MQTLFLMVVQAHAMLPARSMLAQPLYKALRILGVQWKLADQQLMVYEMPRSVYLPLLVLLWLPTQASVVVMLLWLLGIVGEPQLQHCKG